MAGFTKKGNIWYTTLRFNGKQYSITHRTSKEKEAKPDHKYIDSLETQVKRGNITKEKFLKEIDREEDSDSKNRLDELIESFLDFKRNQVTDSTIKTYEETFSPLLDEWGKDLNIQALTPDHYTQFLNRLRTETHYIKRKDEYVRRWNKTSINIKLGCLKCFLNWLVECKFIDYYPFKIKNLKIPEKKRRFITRKEFDKILDNIDKQFYRDVFIFYLNTGLRLGELTNAEIEGQYLKVDGNTTKTRCERYLKMPDELLELYKKIIAKGYKVGSYTKYFTKIRRKAALPEDISFHSLRHTYAFRLCLKHNSWIAKQSLGHKDTDSTDVYTDVPKEYLKQELSGWDKDDDKSSICLKMAKIGVNQSK